MWRDEAQAWLIAVHAESFLDLLVINNEGHPPLYYWMLRALSFVSEDLYLVKVPQGILAVGCLVLVWFASPFGRVEKLLISLGYYLSWQYGVFSRNYTIGVFFCLIYASFYRQLLTRPVLAGIVLGLVAQSHILFAFVAAGLAVPYLIQLWREHGIARQLITFCAVLGGLAFLSLLSIRLSSSASFVEAVQSVSSGNEIIRTMLRQISLPFLHGVPADLNGLILPVAALLIAAFVFTPILGVSFLLSALAISGFLAVIYGGASWHNGTIYITLIVLYGIGYQSIHQRWISRYAILVLLILTVVGNLVTLPNTLSRPYSAAQEAAELIRELGLTDADWASYGDQHATVTFAVLKRPSYGLRCGCQYTYVDWPNHKKPDSEIRKHFERFIDENDGRPKYIMISQWILDKFQRLAGDVAQLEKVGETQAATLPSETFILFKVVNP